MVAVGPENTAIFGLLCAWATDKTTPVKYTNKVAETIV
jgi:hypothetical protein